jgi:hypothetical protein
VCAALACAGSKRYGLWEQLVFARFRDYERGENYHPHLGGSRRLSRVLLFPAQCVSIKQVLLFPQVFNLLVNTAHQKRKTAVSSNHRSDVEVIANKRRFHV